MSDQKKPVSNLPGNHGQFGTNNATENYEPLQNHDDGASPAVPAKPADSVDAGSANPGPHQVQSGMRS